MTSYALVAKCGAEPNEGPSSWRQPTTATFVLPVTDLERARAFHTALGFTIKPAFTDHTQRGLTDPDGNVVDLGWMDPLAAAQGPAAYAEQQV
ncbi:MAG: hypothetical protein ACRYG2_34980 [Janthinobacterium lividum]